MIFTQPPAPIVGHDVEQVWWIAKRLLLDQGYTSSSRAGEVLVMPHPVSTVYLRPTYRVLNDYVRDANPYFHLFEALWMLAGRNDVAWIKQFNARMVEYSDNGETFHGAYGYRWRKHFDLEGGAEEGFTDQLEKVIKQLRSDPLSRRAVVQMWDPLADLWAPSEKPVPKDLPCNTAIYFDCRNGPLNMTVTNRSNDIVWGCYGANVVHMSILQEYMAAKLGVPVGWYTQFSHNWHAYTSVFDKQAFPSQPNEYLGYPYPLVSFPASIDDELLRFLEEDIFLSQRYQNVFFDSIARPMMRAWYLYKSKNIPAALQELSVMPAKSDWGIAAWMWMKRRLEGRSHKQGDAVLGA